MPCTQLGQTCSSKMTVGKGKILRGCRGGRKYLCPGNWETAQGKWRLSWALKMSFGIWSAEEGGSGRRNSVGKPRGPCKCEHFPGKASGPWVYRPLHLKGGLQIIWSNGLLSSWGNQKQESQTYIAKVGNSDLLIPFTPAFGLDL